MTIALPKQVLMEVTHRREVLGLLGLGSRVLVKEGEVLYPEGIQGVIEV